MVGFLGSRFRLQEWLTSFLGVRTLDNGVASREANRLDKRT